VLGAFATRRERQQQQAKLVERAEHGRRHARGGEQPGSFPSPPA
jgi:hypothetical protein